MPVQGFAQGYAQAQAINTDRERLQLEAEEQARLFSARDSVIEKEDALFQFQQRSAEVTEGLQMEIDEGRANLIMYKLKGIGLGVLGGDLSDFNDNKKDRDIKELFLNDSGIQEFFNNPSGLANIRRFNKDDPEDIREYEKYLQGRGAGTADFDPSAFDDDVLVYEMGDGTIQVYDRTALPRALGLGEEFSSIRHMIEDRDKLDAQLLAGKEQQEKDIATLEAGKKEVQEKAGKLESELEAEKALAEKKLAVESPQGGLAQVQRDKIEAETLGLSGGADGVAVLTDVKKILPTVNSSTELYDAIISTHPQANFTEAQADTLYQRELGERKAKLAEGRSKAELNEFYGSIALRQGWNTEGLDLPKDETEAKQVLGAAVQRQIGNTVDLVYDDKGNLSIKRKVRKPFESEVNRALLAPVAEKLSTIETKNTGKPFSEWDEADRNQYLDSYDKATSFDARQFPELSTEERQALDFTKRLSAATNRFTDRVSAIKDPEDAKGIIPDFKNFINQYRSAKDLSPEERGARVAARQLDFFALLSAASLNNNGRMPQWIYDTLRDIQGTTFGTDISAALEGAIAQIEDVESNASTRTTSGGRKSRILFRDAELEAGKVIDNLQSLLDQVSGTSGAKEGQSKDLLN